MPGVDDLGGEELRDALRLLGLEDGGAVHPSRRILRDALTAPGFVADLVGRAPAGAGAAFRRVAVDGAASVEDLLSRGWAGVGRLPEPLDWLQRRGLVVVGDEGLVHASDEARHGWATLTFDLPEPAPRDEAPLLLEEARTVVVAPSTAALDLACAVPGAALRTVAPTVAISDRPPAVVQAALESAGAPVSAAHAVVAVQGAMPLPGVEEEAVGPRAIRALLQRSLEEKRQVRLEYFASSRGGQATERVVDPWVFVDDLLRGWCHLRQDERAFAVDRIGRARLLTTPISHRPA